MNEITKTQAVEVPANVLSSIVLRGDLSGLNEEQKVDYYIAFCRRLGVDPATKPFDILKLKQKQKDGSYLTREIMYCPKGGAAQLAAAHKVSTATLTREIVGKAFVVTCKAWTPDGRQTEGIGVVALEGQYGPLTAQALCNAMMHADTKARRRAVLDLVSLGMLDETEVEDMQVHVGPPPIPPAIAGPSPLGPSMPPQEAPKQATLPPPSRPEPPAEVQPPTRAPEPPKGPPGTKTVGLSTHGDMVSAAITALDKAGVPVEFALSVMRDSKLVEPTVTRIHEVGESALAPMPSPRWMSRLVEKWKASQPAKAAPKEMPKTPPTPPPPQERAPSDESEGSQELPFVRFYAPGNPYADGRELDWQGTPVGFGKDAKLTVGEMGKQKFAWYYRVWQPRPYHGKIDDNSYRLDAALVRAAAQPE